MTLLDNEYCLCLDGLVGVNGPGNLIPQTQVRDKVYLDPNNNIRSRQDCNSFPIFNVASAIPISGVKLTDWYVNQTQRGEVHPTNVSQLNLKGDSVWNNLSFNDNPKVTIKETTEYAYSGNAQRENDGVKFYTYKDNPKVTIKETTEYAYSGNAQRESDGVKFYTYKDNPKVTTKETTEKAYSGNPQRERNATQNYTQFTEGADIYTIRSGTLVQNWILPPGRQNILGEAEARMGKIDFGTFGNDQNYNGPGTIQQALPSADKYQNNFVIGFQRPNPNKLVSVDDRQLAGYQVNQLQKNPLSIFTTDPKGEIPGFECYVDPQNYSTMVNKAKECPGPNQHREGYKGIDSTVAVYPNHNPKMPRVNPNAELVYNENTDSTESNTFVHSTKRIPNAVPDIGGTCYSGTGVYGWNKNGHANQSNRTKAHTGDKNVQVYGNLHEPSKLKYMPNMAMGIENKGLEQAQHSLNPPSVCEGNRAFNFANTLFVQ